MEIENKDWLLASGYATMAVFNGYKKFPTAINLEIPKRIEKNLVVLWLYDQQRF